MTQEISGRVKSIADRFMQYVQIDTQSDPESNTYPSTEKQKNLSRLLVQQLLEMGVSDAEMDEFGYVMATLPSNSQKNVPVLCFCAHVDTAPDVSGKDVKPILHHAFNGSDISLPDDPSQILSVKDHPYLKERIGDDIITASGKTLLGADDKAGVAIIMQLAEELMTQPEIPHGTIRILFTPDEEVGRGVDHLDMKKLAADVGYTLDGGPRGSIEGDTFSANAMSFTFKGISAHPGYAKGKMVNAMKVMAHFMNHLPSEYLSPESTEGKEGFVHPMSMKGELESATVTFLIRDFDTAKLAAHQQVLIALADKSISVFEGAQYQYEIKEQYRNMREVLQSHPYIEDNAILAMKRAGIEPKPDLVRGGTDGSRLSFMGLPCPNLFTGEMAIHSKLEYVSLQDMDASLETLIELVQVYEEKA
jgi:tripeptide aminopeptidase